MAVMMVASAMPAFAAPPSNGNHPFADPTTGKDPNIDKPQEGYVAIYRAPTADKPHEPPTDASGGNPGYQGFRCAGPSNNPTLDNHGC